MGGLGNQLFQIFAVIAYSIEHKQPFYFLNVKTLGGGPNTTLRHTYWDSLLLNITPFLRNVLNTNAFTLREEGFTYKKIPSPQEIKTNEIVLYGYYQSYKYFKKYYSYIIKFLHLNNAKKMVLDKNNITLEEFEDTISLHFRYGDYKKVSYVHPLLKQSYYSSALDYIMRTLPNKEKYIVYCFYEEEDQAEVETILSALGRQYQNIHFRRPSYQGMEDYEELLYMSCCNHHIIANSSFSWWGAYLNDRKEKIVCYPSVWFGENTNNNTRDLCPPEWICIPV
jgi:hypothetical protein